MKAGGGLVGLLALLDFACQIKSWHRVKPRHSVKLGYSTAPGVQDKTLRMLLLDLKQAILGLVDELAQRAVVGGADGSFNGNEFLKQDSVVHEAGPLGLRDCESQFARKSGDCM
jgi:hypothetical protein